MWGHSRDLFVCFVSPRHGPCSAKLTWNRRKYRSFATHVPPFFCAENGGRTCRANRHSVKAQLQRPVQWTPAPVPPPPGADRRGCTTASHIPSWTIHNFRYEHERSILLFNGETLPPVSEWPLGSYFPQQASRIMSIEIRNQATNHLQTCTIQSFDGKLTDTDIATQWYRCYPDTGLAVHFVETYIQFNPATAELRVKETWFCDDTDPNKP